MSRLLESYNNYITFEFGDQTLLGNPIFHDGIDIVGEDEAGNHLIDYILNHTAGIVIESCYDEGRGNHICIQITPTAYMTYNHLDDLRWNEGDTIPQGAVVGLMGRSGNCTGYHLHWGINEGGIWINPEPYLDIDYIQGENAMTREQKEIIVRSCYVESLGRNADQSGLDAYCGIIPDTEEFETYDRSIINRDLCNSDEHKRKYIADCYRVFLGRDPESEAVIDMRMELDYATIADIIYNSDEAKEYRNNG